MSKLSLTSDFNQRRLFTEKSPSLLHRTKLKLALAACAWMLMGAALLLSGCRTQPTLPCEPQPLPTMPALSEPLPSVSYSISVGQRIKNWGLSLTGTQATSKP